LQVAEEALDLANIRYVGVRESYFLGDVPAIDTVEAYTQVLSRLFNVREAQNFYVESINLASAYIWSTEGNPVMLPPFIRPKWAGDIPSEGIFVPISIEITHPELLKLLFKREILDIDRRLAAEYLSTIFSLKMSYPLPLRAIFFPTMLSSRTTTILEQKCRFPFSLEKQEGKLG